MAVSIRKNTVKIRLVLEQPCGTNDAKSWVEGWKKELKYYEKQFLFLPLLQWDFLSLIQLKITPPFFFLYFFFKTFLLNLAWCRKMGVCVWDRREAGKMGCLASSSTLYFGFIKLPWNWRSLLVLFSLKHKINPKYICAVIVAGGLVPTGLSFAIFVFLKMILNFKRMFKWSSWHSSLPLPPFFFFLVPSPLVNFSLFLLLFFILALWISPNIYKPTYISL